MSTSLVAVIPQLTCTLRKCFHISHLKPFYKNLREELTKMPKVYFNDLGLRNSLINLYASVDLWPDKGALIKNHAFLRVKQLHGNDAMHFRRTSDGKTLIISKVSGIVILCMGLISNLECEEMKVEAEGIASGTVTVVGLKKKPCWINQLS